MIYIKMKFLVSILTPSHLVEKNARFKFSSFMVNGKMASTGNG